MKVSYQFLHSLFPQSLTPQALAEHLTQQGIEVEWISRPLREYQLALGVFHSRDGSQSLLKIEGHDLFVQTDFAIEDDRQYLCLFDQKHQEWKLCTPFLLGWSQSSAAMWVPDGLSIDQAWGLDDVVMELSLTPNRGDCLNYMGICREVALSLRQPFSEQKIVKQFQDKYPVTWEAITTCALDIDESLAPIYGISRVYCPTRLHTPFWLERFLLKHGIGLHMPSVDLGHYLMMVFGIPMHAFDAGAVQDQIHVQWHHSSSDLNVQFLDQKVVALKDRYPAITNAQNKMIALPGVMGTLESAAQSDSHELLIECALFDPSAIRSLRRFGMVTAASLRFERGVDRCLHQEILTLYCGMLQSFHPQVLCWSPLIQRNSKASQSIEMQTTFSDLERIAGVSLDASEIEKIIEFYHGKYDRHTGVITAQRPSWRWDLESSRTWLAEILRAYGMNHFSVSRQNQNSSQRRMSFADPVIDAFVNKGFAEVVTYSFIHRKFAALFESDEKKWIDLVNPVSADLEIMRPSLWPSLLQVLNGYQRFGCPLRPIVEKAHIFSKDYDLRQKAVVAGVIPVQKEQMEWRQDRKQKSEFGYYEMKGLLSEIGMPHGTQWVMTPEKYSFLHPHFQGELVFNQRVIGVVGRIHPEMMAAHEWCDSWLFEIHQEAWSASFRARPEYRAFSRLPMIKRDFAFVCPSGVQAADLKAVFEECCQHLRSLHVFDYYVPQDGSAPSLGLSVILQGRDQSLSDEEVQSMMDRTLQELYVRYGVVLKGFPRTEQ